MSSDNSQLPLDQRKLSDLTDYEVASLTQELKAEEASKRPLVGEVEPLERLSDEYKNETFLAKIASLQRDSWTGLRRLRGDGDCFYRAFAFSYLERLIPLPPSAAQLALAKVESLLPLLDQAGFQKDIYDDFYEPLRDLLLALGPDSKLPRPTATSLHASFNDTETSNAIIVFLRLLTSAFLRANADDFTPFLFGLEDDPRFMLEGGAPTMDQFCSFHVEAVNKEADHIQITALTRALSVYTRIAYLDQSGAPPGGFGAGAGENGDVKVDFVEFEGESEEKLNGALLYRPGHYDVLYR
ncbi:peptidase C65 Otubain-domain-containing protein [Leucosporidium creatinivorum]|uniref:ubiquitinyl hydrolase 1 n=1 Tax=Leucosporidium creatinivorum TaxID=106004 RepID=A0A1Y2EMY3_9BASI|nr:peptidase C65 Otubain-domain-containing protein [Leucosporidium creatinivorum]